MRKWMQKKKKVQKDVMKWGSQLDLQDGETTTVRSTKVKVRSVLQPT